MSSIIDVQLVPPAGSISRSTRQELLTPDDDEEDPNPISKYSQSCARADKIVTAVPSALFAPHVTFVPVAVVLGVDGRLSLQYAHCGGTHIRLMARLVSFRDGQAFLG